MHRQNHRRSRVAGALAAAILYGTALAFASSLNGTSTAQATTPREEVTAVAAVAQSPAEDPLATFAIVGIGVGMAGIWQLRRIARRRPKTAPGRLQPVPARVTTLR